MSEKDEASGSVKYQNPKVLLLDMDSDVAHRLTKAGYNISEGSLGRPYKVPTSSDYLPVINNHHLPAYKEQEVVVVDFGRKGLDSGPNGDQDSPEGEFDIYAKQNLGVIDPRARLATGLTADFDRCFHHGAWFIVFAHPDIGHELVVAERTSYGHTGRRPFDGGIWRLTSVLNQVGVNRDSGKEMSAADPNSMLGRLLTTHLKEADFTCTLSDQWPLSDNWVPLVRNKYNQTVGAMAKFEKAGGVLILPRLADVPGFLEAVLSDILPELAPQLFPDEEHRGWTQELEYELVRVTKIKEQQETLIKDARTKLAELNTLIDTERVENGWLHDLLTGTDHVLVSAVKNALEELGLEKVVDVDVERDKEGKSRREDLQLHDMDHVLVVDVKGVAGGTADEHALQAVKHAILRLREWKTTIPTGHMKIEDVTGLAIVNHQRHVPPLDRENDMPFRQEMLDAADEQTFGLLTAWDLYRMVRNKERWGWSEKQMIPIIYRKGRILPIPTHYHPIGRIAKAWTDKFGLVLETDKLLVGDTIAVEFPILFEQIVVTSMQVNDTKVKVAGKGDQVGLLWPSKDCKLREGMLVYVLRPEISAATEAS